MGVAGSGKSTLALRLAEQLGWFYLEGDDFHSLEAKQMMASGTPIRSEMRDQWVGRLCAALQDCAVKQQPVVLSYSGLIRKHREQIRLAASNPQFIYLQGSAELLAQRLAQRQNHFMPVSMLQSQLATMESVEQEADVLCLDINQSVKALVQYLLLKIKTCGSA
ncbi:MAG: AAA family ATPase [Gammaproteobacteria bacterium]|nr:AAA family ATPase [Gammaproteobacteria bacterium]MBU2057510.1 AAA family ATPase [Gammaproteobacteria bacterium]MBU2176270.1 AAA family ATPase [Gammaproteobacteria bacterium]MBU2245871.1 AAA family ATPase [Gammaproteobacteria bacterium]MBU2344143.1 AAA family ATPase [Gammaproteobacteria bacterium]